MKKVITNLAINKQEECKITFERKAIYLMKNNKAKSERICVIFNMLLCVHNWQKYITTNYKRILTNVSLSFIFQVRQVQT